MTEQKKKDYAIAFLLATCAIEIVGDGRELSEIHKKLVVTMSEIMSKILELTPNSLKKIIEEGKDKEIFNYINKVLSMEITRVGNDISITYPLK